MARWRDPAGWSLRGRLIAIMVALLAVLGVVVGASTAIFLHRALYDQLDTKLRDTAPRAQFGPGLGLGLRGGEDGNRPPPGATADWIVYRFDGSDDPGGRVAYPAQSTTASSFDAYFARLSSDTIATLSQIAPNNQITQVDLGRGLGEYRVIAGLSRDHTTITVTAAPLADVQATLLELAVVAGIAVLMTLLAAGWGGAVIIRRTLMPLSRVAATATKVSELELGRGEVDLAQRVPEGDTDLRTEVGQVGAALNKMLDHVGSALEARHASEMQVRQFVADASHELRTPLAAIRGYAELSRRSRQAVPDEIAHVLNRVESEARRMTTLVEDLLLLARLDAGRPLAHDPVDLTMLVVDSVSDAHAAGPRHDWQLDLPDEPVTVIGDGARLHQVLANLLANARTHTPEGTTVTVGVSATNDVAMIRVIDGGPGIPVELQPHIYERFARGDSSRSRAAGSTGLGLSIVHAVVTAHGGRVTVASQPGRTQFTVLLPFVPQTEAARSTDAVQQDFAQVVQ